MIHCNIPHLTSNTINGFTGGSTMMSLIGTIEIDKLADRDDENYLEILIVEKICVARR